jgi:hypothetical protein
LANSALPCGSWFKVEFLMKNKKQRSPRGFFKVRAEAFSVNDNVVGSGEGDAATYHVFETNSQRSL